MNTSSPPSASVLSASGRVTQLLLSLQPLAQCKSTPQSQLLPLLVGILPHLIHLMEQYSCLLTGRQKKEALLYGVGRWLDQLPELQPDQRAGILTDLGVACEVPFVLRDLAKGHGCDKCIVL
jgi:hypothetical protein